MFDVKISGKVVSVIRKAEFPKIDPLPSKTLELPSTVTLDLAGLDEKSPAAKKVLNAFASAYSQALTKAAAPRKADNAKIWKAAAEKIKNDEDPKKVEKEVLAALEKRWSEFEKKFMNKTAEDTVIALVNKELGVKEGKNFKPKAKYNSKGTWKDLIGVIGGLAGFAALSTATGGLALLGTALAGASAMVSARKLSEKHYLKLDIMRKRVDKALEEAAGSLSSLDPQLKAMVEHQEQLGLLIIKDQNEANRLAKELKTIKTHYKDDPGAQKLIAQAEKQVSDIGKLIAAQKNLRKKLMLDLKTVRDAKTAIEKASTDFVATRSAYDGFLQLAEKTNDTVGAVGGTMEKLKGLVK